MQTRRSILKRTVAGVAACVMPAVISRRAGASVSIQYGHGIDPVTGDCLITIEGMPAGKVILSRAQIDEMLRQRNAKTIPGISYFVAPYISPPDGKRVYLNGRDVQNFTTEAHLGEGWARVYRNDGENILFFELDSLDNVICPAPKFWFERKEQRFDGVIDLMYGHLEVR